MTEMPVYVVSHVREGLYLHPQPGESGPRGAFPSKTPFVMFLREHADKLIKLAQVESDWFVAGCRLSIPHSPQEPKKS